MWGKDKMHMSYAIVADSFEETKGGIENHARILSELLISHGNKVEILDYRGKWFKSIKNHEIVIIEGIHRIQLLRLAFTKFNGILFLFTHGSFYLLDNRRRDLRRRSKTKYLTFKRIFDRIFMRRILNVFQKIFTLSNTETEDLSKMFIIGKEKISELEVFSDESEGGTNNYHILQSRQDSFLCYIGRVDARKNLISLLMAAIKLDIKLVVAGQDQGSVRELISFCKRKNFKKFSYLGIVSKEKKLELLRSAALIVIPSFFEGTPLLAVEAIKQGKNVVMTKNSYMPHNQCIFFTAVDVRSLTNAIKLALSGPGCLPDFPTNAQVYLKFLEVLKREYDERTYGKVE